MPAHPRDWKSLFPWEPHGLTLPEGRISYVDTQPGGPPEALLCVHGNPTWSFLWRDLVAVASPFRRVIALDHLGCGRSERPLPGEGRLTLTGHAERLASLIDQLGLERVHLAVHDWGGPIGLLGLFQSDARLASLVVTNTSAFFAGRIPRRIALCRGPRLGRFLTLRLNAFVEGLVWMGVHRKRPLRGAVASGFRAPYRKPDQRRAIHRFIEDIPKEGDHPSRPALQELESRLERELQNVSSLILWGMRDFCFTPLFLKQWRQRLPQARVLEFPDAGHLVLEDAGSPALDAIVRFLR